ncbi:heavy metal translocating P-type ATPase [Symbiobacterium thermophilum]|uniref:Putative cadmium-transporting ATPase n=1 Tax=Symbiobacterium thermophilum (strain DSM 24528 / JCM 14929 / IAM 14863 / T) TaxID=292459 RepID=Q67KE0_SYMTH|nr:heavy metal translocating P-type ATPase [Symbiobacterium thermophilum]BAD41858.1 putative cadmium-transporting ATPase [Symbiobacterium thermophilum IAM 14863]
MFAVRADLMDDELRPLVRATVLSGLFLVVGWMWERLAPGLAGWAAAAYAAAYVSGGYLRVRDGLAALRQGSLNIDMLMVLGAAGAAALGRWSEGAVLIFLFALSNTLEEFASGRTRRAIEALVRLRPEEALVRDEDGRERLVPLEEVNVGDLVVVRPAERLGVDGVVVEGRSAVDQAAITGESVPVAKAPGAQVLAGSVNTTGMLLVRVTRPATDSTLARIIRLVEEAQEHKARAQRVVDWVDRYYTLIVVAVALFTWTVPPLAAGWAWSDSFYLAMQLLVVMSPCALVIATPAALLSGIAAGARQGILFKGGIHLEQAGIVRVVAFDKTGTLTEGRPELISVLPAEGVSEAELLRLAAAAELRSGHPLGQAIVAAARRRLGELPQPEQVEEQPGLGVSAVVDGRRVLVGSRRLLESGADEWMSRTAGQVETRGETAVLVIADGRPLGVLGVADRVRPQARAVVEALRTQGIQRVVMLTGDNERVAAAVAAETGVDEFQANLLPGDKLRAIEELERLYGPVAMVGDGINDAPALARASLGVAMGGAGNDAALESADVVLMADDLARLTDVFRMGRLARKVVGQNLAFAVGVIVMLVVLSLMGRLTLPLAVVGHEGSTILVAVNGLRLLMAGRRALPREPVPGLAQAAPGARTESAA